MSSSVIGPVLFVSGISGGTRRYRCDHHREQLAIRGIASSLREHDDPMMLFDAISANTVILHRVPFSPLINDLIQLAETTGKPVIFETDDLTFDASILSQIRYLDAFNPKEAKAFEDCVSGQAQTLMRCNFLLTTTESLAAAGAKLGKLCYVHRNACSEQLLKQSELAYAHRCECLAADTTTDAPIVLGYFSGTASHDHDFASITPALVTILNRYPRTRLRLVGPLRLDHRLKPFRHRIDRLSLLPWQELPQQIARIDINLAPLEPNNIFCEAKSELKYFEAALLGVPTIASPTQAFRYAIRHGENGLLADTEGDWERSLTELIEQPEQRRLIGIAARTEVLREYTPERRSVELEATLQQIRTAFEMTTKGSPEPLMTAQSIVNEKIQGYFEQQIAICQEQNRNLLSLQYLIPRIGKLFVQRLRKVASDWAAKVTG